MKYSVGKQVVTLHVLCGEWWEVLNPDGARLCVIVGGKAEAQKVVDLLNEEY